MPVITVQPEGFVIEGPSGATIMEAARALGYYWPTTCDGQGICTSCATQVLKGMENLSPMGRSEQRTLEGELSSIALRRGAWRLACQARLLEGDVEVLKRGVRPPEVTRDT
jgi:2Fe-2S ferredoxin